MESVNIKENLITMILYNGYLDPKFNATLEMPICHYSEYPLSHRDHANLLLHHPITSPSPPYTTATDQQTPRRKPPAQPQ